MMSRIFVRSLFLFGLTLLLIGALAAYALLMQPKTTAPLSAALERVILWPWQWDEGARVAVSFQPPSAGRQQPEAHPVKALTLVIDTSGSMSGEPLQQARRAATEFLNNLNLGSTGGSAGVNEFSDTDANVSPLDTNIQTALDFIQQVPHNSSSSAVIPPLRKVLADLAGKGIKKGTVLVLSDFQVEAPNTLRQFFEQEWRPKGHELFLLGAGDVNHDAMMALTDDPAVYVVTSTDLGAQTLFEEAIQRLRTRLGSAVSLNLPWSKTMVAPIETPTTLTCDRLPADPVATGNYALAPLFARDQAYCWTTVLKPLISGLLPILHRPYRLDYIDAADQPQTVESDARSPLLLAVSWWWLLPILLYLLGEWLAYQLRPRESPIPEPVLQRPHHSLLIPPLRHRLIDPNIQTAWMPTLIIGLGGSGRQVLTHVGQALLDTRCPPGAEPLLLALDVARDESAELVPGCLSRLPDDAVFWLPETACQLQRQVNAPFDSSVPFDLGPYQLPPWTPEKLGLAKGTYGEGRLARLALLNDLRQGDPGSALLTRLRDRLDQWRGMDSAATHRQIILVGNTQGGVTRGWLSDLLVLLRRLTATDETGGTAVELSVLLLGETTVYDADNHPLRTDDSALFDELDRLACAGRLPFRQAYGGNGVLAEQWVKRRPQDTLFVMTAARDKWACELYPNAADALLLLADSRRRRDMTGVLEGLRAEEGRIRIGTGRETYTEIALRSASFPHSFQRRLIELTCLGHLYGKQVLSPGFNDSNQELPVVLPASLLDWRQCPAESPTEEALLRLAAGEGAWYTPEPDDLPPAIEALWLHLKTAWGKNLLDGGWNLATLAAAARQMAKNLQPGGQDLAEVVNELERLAAEAVQWIARTLGASTARQVAGSLDIPESVPDLPSDMEKLRVELGAVRKRFEEWRANPTRTSVLCWQDGDEVGLLYDWLRSWLGSATDPNAELRKRCRFELCLPSSDTPRPHLKLAFSGVKSKRYGLDELPAFSGHVRSEVEDSLWPDMQQRFLDTLSKQMGNEPETGIARFAARLKGELRGDKAVLLVSMPGRMVAGSDSAERIRQALRQALRQTADASELPPLFHDAHDPFRFLLWRLLPLKTSHPQQDNPPVPVHTYECLRTDYGQRVAKRLGRESALMPVSAGLALIERDSLTAFAGLWLAGHIQREPATGLWSLAIPNGGTVPIALFPQENLADAAAHFVGGGCTAEPPGPVPERQPDPNGDGFENLLCLLWLQRQGHNAL